ncbi:MAG: ATP-binding protein [Polyangiaceae bacterium]|nr:ATP-binding protein [Polyangiaceae bacterium]
MRPTAFEFEQYRSFLSPARVRLGGKLTLLYGYNNAGKSALLRGLVMMAASCKPRAAKPNQLLALDHPAVRGTDFLGLVTRGPHAPRIKLGLAWGDDRVSLALLAIYSVEERTGTPVVEVIKSDGFDLNATWQPNEELEPIYEVPGANPIAIDFDGLLVGPPHQRLRAAMQEFGQSMHWLPPTREPPRSRYTADGREYVPEDPIPFLQRLGPDNAVYVHVQSALNRLAGVDLVTGRDSQGAYATVSPRGLPARAVPLLSVGEGINQVLPVVALAAMALEGRLGQSPLVAIEQPELHLHPAAELALVDVLLEACAGDARFILETHSETLLLGLQLAVAEGRLAPDDVSVCWVERDEGGLSTVRDVPLRKDGSREGWPPGVFSEHLAQSRKILEARENARK